MSLFDELKRRNVFRVAVGYIVLAWLLLQVGDTLAPALLLPGWVSSALAFFLILGFPVAIFFAWAFELTPQGFRREQPADSEDKVKAVSGRKMDRVILVLMAAALGYFVFDKFFTGTDKPAGPANTVVDESPVPVGEPLATAPGSRPVSEHSIAVLPFVNMSSDPEQEYFSDGLSEELLNLLAKIPTLKVTSRSSAFAFKGEAINVPEVASQLGVAHILEGSVRKSGNRIRVTAQLIDARNDVHLWAETYDRNLDDIFAIQDEISLAVVTALRLVLLGDMPAARKINPEALDLNMQASYFWHRRGQGDLHLAKVAYEKSLSIDERNAPAWSGLAVIYSELRNTGEMTPEESERLFAEAAQNAVSADPDYPEGHIRLAWSLFRSGDLEGAEKERAIAFGLDPGNSLVIFDRAVQLQHQGKLEEAIIYHEKIAEIDPLSAVTQANLASFYMELGRLEDAEISVTKALQLSPDMPSALFNQVLLRLLQRRPQEALALAENLPKGNMRLVLLSTSLSDLGETERSQAALDEISPDGGRIPPEAYQLQVHAYRGELDQAFSILEKAIGAGIGFSTFLYDPFLQNLHDDPRWLPLMRKGGYNPDS